MGVKHIAFAVCLIVSVVAVAGRAVAIELGELQAIPSHPPPYMFRLAILSAPHGSLDTPAVTVRQPHDALSLVKNNTLELRLRSLTDVELEVSHGSQTLNRLLMKSELQGAHARLDAATSWQRYRAAQAKSSPRPQLIALLDTAYQAHQAWGQFDPDAARQPLAQVTQERLRFLAADTRHAVPIITDGTPDKAVLEREMLVIREEMRHLMARVTAWAKAEAPARQPQGRDATWLLPLLLGGVFMAGLTALFTGYLMQRRLSGHAPQRRRAFAAAVRRARAELTAGTFTLPAGRWNQLSEGRPAPQELAAVVRHLRLSHRTKRRVHVRAWQENRALSQPRAAEHTQGVARIAHTRASAAAELIEALGNLRQELLHLQHLLMTSSTFARTDSSPGRGAR